MAFKLIYCFCLIVLLNNISFSMIAPFYPLMVQQKGFNTFYIGFVFSASSIATVISSFVTGRKLKSFRRSRGIMIGIFIIIISLFGFGSLQLIDDELTFYGLSLFFKLMCGTGIGINLTSILSIVATKFSQEREKTIGIVQATMGVGCLIGPIYGAILYSIGGYILPFFIMAILYTLIYPFIISQIKDISEENLVLLEDNHEEKQLVSLRNLIKSNIFIFGLISQTFVYTVITLILTQLSLHLSELSYNIYMIALAFTIASLMFAFACKFTYVLTNIFIKPGVVLIGYMVCFLGLLLVGPSVIFGQNVSSSLTFYGIAFAGASAGFIITPQLPNMIEVIEKQFPNQFDKKDLHSQLSGYYSSFQFLGQAIGPISGSILNAAYGFRSMVDIMNVFDVILLILYFLFCGQFQLLKRIPRVKSSFEFTP